MTLSKKTSILALLAIFAKAPLAVAGEEKELPGDNHAMVNGGEYQSIPAAVADEPVAGGGGSASAAPSEFDHTYSEEATAKLIRRFQYEGRWRSDLFLNENFLKTIQIYINDGADVNVTDENENTLLMYAVLSNDLTIARLLLNKGAHVNITDMYGFTALMYALQKNNVNMVECLLNHFGIEVNIANRNGNTALMYAVLAGNVDMVQCLLDKGADVNATDLRGLTALMLAVQLSTVDMVQLLLDKGGAKANTKNLHGCTALMLAVIENNVDMIQRLLEKGADVNIEDNEGKTALDYIDEVPLKSKEIRALLNKYAPPYVLK